MKIRDMLFWILILIAIGVAIWLMVGSPTIEEGLLIIVISLSSSEILLWKSLFKIDKRTAVGFERVKSRIKILENNINIQFSEVKDLIKKNGN